MKFLFFLISFLSLSTCFSATVKPSATTPLPPDSLNCDTLWLKSGGIKIVKIISDNGYYIKFTECPPNEIVSQIPKSSTKLSPRDSVLAAKRATMCDTIYLKGGEVVTGHMKYYNNRKVVYTGCCLECETEKILKRKDVDSIVYVDGRRLWTKKPGETNISNNPNNNINNTTSTQPEEKEYTPEEKEKAKKNAKLFGYLGLIGGGAIAVTGALLLILVATTNPVVFGVIFFAGVIFGLIMAMLYVRNRKKAGIQKKKRNRK